MWDLIVSVPNHCLTFYLECFHLLHLAPNVNKTVWAWWAGIEWVLKLRFGEESKNGWGIWSGVRYIAHLYVLVVQADFYSNAVECWLMR